MHSHFNLLLVINRVHRDCLEGFMNVFNDDVHCSGDLRLLNIVSNCCLESLSWVCLLWVGLWEVIGLWIAWDLLCWGRNIEVIIVILAGPCEKADPSKVNASFSRSGGHIKMIVLRLRAIGSHEYPVLSILVSVHWIGSFAARQVVSPRKSLKLESWYIVCEVQLFILWQVWDVIVDIIHENWNHVITLSFFHVFK